ncbi:MAG: virulence factor MviN, partial [Psychroserpens sp.]|nr:virulence factor MviN [Psychroserpens sp.]
MKNATVTNILIVGIVTLFVKGLGFLKEAVIADSFGLSELIDTFYIAILIPGFMSNVFLGGFKSVFIPNYVIELKTGKNVNAFQTTCFLVTVAVALLFCIIAILFTDVYLETFFSGHTEQYYQLIKNQFYYVIPCMIFWGLSSMLNGLLTIYDEFTFSSMNSVFTPLTIMVCIIFFKEELGVTVLAKGTLIGSIL